MKKLFLAFVSAITVTSSALAGTEKTLQCDFSDSTLKYRDVFEISANGSVSYTGNIASLSGEFSKACWSNDVLAKVEKNEILFSGVVECVGGDQTNLNQTLNLSTMTMNGTWKGSYPCSWVD